MLFPIGLRKKRYKKRKGSKRSRNERIGMKARKMDERKK